MKWTREEARTYLVNYHMINTTAKPTIEAVFERLQSIQFDPLNVVGHNSDLVLQSRIRSYKKDDIKKYLYTHRTLMDGWDKQMCVYSTKDFHRFLPVRDERAERGLRGYKKHYGTNPYKLNDQVLSIIDEKGPIMSSKISLGQTKKSRWGAGKQSGASIDYLFHKGLIGVYSRNNTHKLYDLMDRLLPLVEYHNPILEEEAFIDWYLLRRIKSLGLCSNSSGVHFSGLHIKNKKIRTKHFERLINQGLIQDVEVDGIGTLYLPKEALDFPVELVDRISFIAPLDNIIWDRELMTKLWDFNYIWEVYTPPSKRRWGYYVLPILKGNKIIGRIEFEKHRGNDKLNIIGTSFLPNIKKTKKLEKMMNVALRKFAKYLGAKDVQVFEI